MSAPRNVPLIERRADVKRLEEEIRQHKADCDKAPRCETYKELAAELKAARDEIRTWFAPGPDQGELF